MASSRFRLRPPRLNLVARFQLSYDGHNGQQVLSILDKEVGKRCHFGEDVFALIGGRGDVLNLGSGAFFCSMTESTSHCLAEHVEVNAVR